MNQEYKNLRVTSLTPEMHARTCNYWYTVTDSAYAHVAFETRNGLMHWLVERGLELEGELPKHGTYGSVAVIGSYRARMHGSYDQFFALASICDTKVMSNGDYTMARITRDGDGILTVHTLNPNCRFRPVYDYSVTAKEMR